MATKANQRIGNQEPTVSSFQPYDSTMGDRAIKIYNTRKRAALDWQRNVMNPLLAVGKVCPAWMGMILALPRLD